MRYKRTCKNVAYSEREYERDIFLGSCVKYSRHIKLCNDNQSNCITQDLTVEEYAKVHLGDKIKVAINRGYFGVCWREVEGRI